MNTSVQHKKSVQSSAGTAIPIVRQYREIEAYRKLENKNIVVDCGWGRLMFGQTFDDSSRLAEMLTGEDENRRDIAFYLQDPHVLLSMAPQELFLDPSHTYRLFLHERDPESRQPVGFRIRRLQQRSDAEAVSRILKINHMLPAEIDFMCEHSDSQLLTYLIAEEPGTGNILGTVTGVDHVQAFDDPGNSASLWCLAVDPQAPYPGIGRSLINRLADYYRDQGRKCLDLSVMYDNEQAIRLYEEMGFKRIPIFCVKRKNPINEKLYTRPLSSTEVNPYAHIIIEEAARRGINVEVLDAEAGYFSMNFGGRSVVCRESLSEVTSAIAMSRCADKRLTWKLVKQAGVKVPDQITASDEEANAQFLQNNKRIVVKPADSEQGLGISVDIRGKTEMQQAIEVAAEYDNNVLLEEYIEGEDVRVVIIDYETVAVAVRRTACVKGNSRDTIKTLIEKQSRRRQNATGGESRIPLDEFTVACIESQGYRLDDILPAGKTIRVRRTANLHTGGTIHDITDRFSPVLKEVSEQVARDLNIPVVGLDLIVPDLEGDDYWFIEANERPGLANHEPQPTAQRFVDFLFPVTKVH